MLHSAEDDGIHLPRPTPSRRLGALFAVYLTAVGAGFLALGAHGASGSEAPEAPAGLPHALERAMPPSDGPTAVYVLHAACPCAAADVEALARLAATAPSGTRWCIVAVPLPDAPNEAGRTAARLAEVTGATLLLDREGTSKRALGAQRSGALYVFQPSGALAFAGGLTEARGHAGPARADHLARAAFHTSAPDPRAVRLPVRGCPLP